jgi:GDPmannose 4,6-dehydratase
MKKSLIKGIIGQDGTYLTGFLLAKVYHVHDTNRRYSHSNTEHVDNLYQDPHWPFELTHNYHIL